MQDSTAKQASKQALASAGADQDIVTVRMSEWKRHNRLRGTTLASATVVKDAYIINLRPNVTQVRQRSLPSTFAGEFSPLALVDSPTRSLGRHGLGRCAQLFLCQRHLGRGKGSGFATGWCKRRRTLRRSGCSPQPLRS